MLTFQVTANLERDTTVEIEVLDARTGVRLGGAEASVSRQISSWRTISSERCATAWWVAPMDALDVLANDAFAGRVVRKDLVRQVKVGANVPVYVLEFLLGKYCASDDPAAIATGLQVVNQTLQENFIRPDESEQAKAALKRKGQHRLIDKVDVRLVASEDKFWAHLSNFGDKYVNIPEEIVYKYERLLGGGVWCQLDLLYNASTTKSQEEALLHTSSEAHPGCGVRYGGVRRREGALHARRVARSRHALDRSGAHPSTTCAGSSSPLSGSCPWSSGTTT